MSDQPIRFRIVGGTDVMPEVTPAPKPKKPRKKRPPMKDQLQRWHCAKCSQEAGFEQHQMVQVLRNPHEANGKMVAGSLWWACARCLTPYYFIREIGSKR